MNPPTEQGAPARWQPTDPQPTWLDPDRRPEGVDDDTVAAVGKPSEAMEWVERARRPPSDFHQMMGPPAPQAGAARPEQRRAGKGAVGQFRTRGLAGRQPQNHTSEAP